MGGDSSAVIQIDAPISEGKVEIGVCYALCIDPVRTAELDDGICGCYPEVGPSDVDIGFTAGTVHGVVNSPERTNGVIVAPDGFQTGIVGTTLAGCRVPVDTSISTERKLGIGRIVMKVHKVMRSKANDATEEMTPISRRCDVFHAVEDDVDVLDDVRVHLIGEAPSRDERTTLFTPLLQDTRHLVCGHGIVAE